MEYFWLNLTDGQGAFLSGAITAVGAIVAVLIAQKLFGNRVSGLKDGVEQTEKTVKDFEALFDQKITNLSETFNEVLSGVERSLATTQAAIYETRKTEECEDESDDGSGDPSSRDRVAEYWHKIRDKIEEIASSPNIDGRTRAKYSRLDRRSYYDLVEKLHNDGHLSEREMADEAIYLWYSCRRKADVEEASATAMENYWDEVSKWPLP